MANTKKGEGEKAIRQTVSFYEAELNRLMDFCNRHPFQPSMSMVIRIALREYLDREEPRLPK